MNARTISLSKRLAVVGVVAIACLALCLALPSHAYAANASNLKAGTVASAQKDTAHKVSVTAKKKTKVHKIKTAKQWRNIAKYKGGTFKLTKNIKLTSYKQYLTITKNKKYVIDLNGHKVTTTYSGVALRDKSPLVQKKGTVIVKDSTKKKKGTLYSTETAAVTVLGGKFYLKSGTIVNDAVEFRSDITSAIYLYGSAKAYLQGKSRVRSIGNGIALFGSSKLYVTGNPWVRAGYNTYQGQFTHYGSGISVASKNARISLKGGSFGTMASPDVNFMGYSYAMSANYPILDQYGFALDSALPAGYKYVDAAGQNMTVRKSNLTDVYSGNQGNAALNNAFYQIYGYYPTWENALAQFGMKSELRLTTTVKDAAGYYSVYVRKA